MARTKPPPRLPPPPSSSDRDDPREGSTQGNKSTEEQTKRSAHAQSGTSFASASATAASTTKAAISVPSRDKAGTTQPSGSRGRRPGNESSGRSSTSASRTDHSGSRHRQDQLLPPHHHPPRDYGRHSGRGRDTSDQGQDRGSYGYREYDRDRRGDRRDHDDHRRRDDRRLRNSAPTYHSSWGRDRGGSYQQSHHDHYSDRRDHRDCYERPHHADNFDGQGYSGRYEKRQRYGYDQGGDSFAPNRGYDSDTVHNDYQHHPRHERRPNYGNIASDDPTHGYGPTPVPNEYQTQHERRPNYGAASVQNEYHRQGNQPSPEPAPSQPPSNAEISATEKLKLELEKKELETLIAKQQLELERTKIAKELLEKEKIQQQLDKIKSNDPVQPENDSEGGVATQETHARSGDATSLQHSIGDAAADDDDDDDEVIVVDDVPPARKSATEKVAQRQRRAKAPTASRKKNTKRRSRGKSKLPESTKRELREAQESKDEKMKLRLLKEYEEKMAKSKSRKMHKKKMAKLKSKNMEHYAYTEESLMSKFIPEIIDHRVMMDGQTGKLLVKWKEAATSKKGSKPAFKNDDHCLQWISHEEFLFPALAQKYLTSKINSITCKDEIKALKSWIRNCKDHEEGLNVINTPYTVEDADEEFESHREIDFCCFLCQCEWSHPLKHTIRNCEYGLKYHRACCHGYEDKDAFESFVSPLGEALLESLGLSDAKGKSDNEGESQNKTADKAEAAGKDITGIVHCSSPGSIVDGKCERFHQCLQNRSNMFKKKWDADAVVLCINAGVGSAAVALKGLGIRMAKVIHVESDKVARHVIQANHDSHYGGPVENDGIEHIVGLYESLAEIREDPEKLVKRHGPIDIMICFTPQGKSTKESAQLSHDFFDFISEVERLNVELHRFNNLFYLLQSRLCIKDHLPLEGLSHYSQAQSLYVCNWPISSLKASFLGSVETIGLPQDYVLHAVTNLYDSVHTALCVGPRILKWRDEIHPKYWTFLSLGPTGYDMKATKGEGLEALMLRLRAPGSAEALSDVNYSNYLTQKSPPVQLLGILLSPLGTLFNQKNYGPKYDIFLVATQKEPPTSEQDRLSFEKPNKEVVATQQEQSEHPSGIAAVETGDVSRQNSNNNIASVEARQQKTPGRLCDTATFGHGDTNPPASYNDSTSSNSSMFGVKEGEGSTEVAASANSFHDANLVRVKEEELSTEGEISNDENDPQKSNKTNASTSTSPVPPMQEIIDLEQEENAEALPALNIDSQPIALATTAPPPHSFISKQSPYANDMQTPTTEVVAGNSQLALSQNKQPASASQQSISRSQARGIIEEEEHLCVVCEDEKKQVMLLPCKHMSLCKTCAHKCLFKTIKECPMCRSTIDNSMEVFW